MLKTFLIMNEGYMNETAVYDENGEHTKEDLLQTIHRIVRAFFKDDRVSPGKSTITMAMPNSFEMVCAVMAANAIGLKVFFLDYLENESHLIEKSKEIGATYLFTKEAILALDGGETPTRYFWPFFVNFLSEFHDDNYERVMEKYSEYQQPTIFLQTSGSTSVPKVLPFTNSAIYAAMIFALNSTKIQNHDNPDRKLMTILSARLPFGFMTGFLPILWGQEVVFASGAAPEDIAKYYKYNCSLIFGTPVLLQAIMKLTPEGADWSALKKFYSSGLSTPDELFPAAEEFFKAHGSDVKICNNYGFGEGLGIGTASDTVNHIYGGNGLPGTSGKFYIGPKWVVVDDDLNEVKYGEVGELIVDSPSLCEGYLGNSEATEEAFVKFRGKTFFKTGDYVSVDTQGYVRYFGRKKRFYQPFGAGDKVSCEAIEKIIYSLDFVEQAAVVPVTNDENVTIGKAFVTLKNTISEEDAKAQILAEFNEMLKEFQIPESIVFLDKLPLMASGKIDYRKLQTL